MESCFTYNTIAQGYGFLSRKRELSQFVSAIGEGRSILICEPPKTGKQSFVEHGFTVLKPDSGNFTVCRIDMMNIVCETQFFHALSEEFENCFFGEELYLPPAAGIEMNIDKEDWEALFALPENIAKEKNIRVIVYFKEFQNILKFEDPDKIISVLARVCRCENGMSFIFTGSSINAMKSIFDQNRNFGKSINRIKFLPLEEKAVTDMIIKVFLQMGRVVRQEQAERIYESVNGHPWYIWQISQVAYNLTKGYLNDNIIEETIISVMTLHEVRFKGMMADLSNYQISYLRVVFDGNAKNNSTEIIAKYHLNSSANIHRLRGALAKKEIISFDENDVPYIIDPLFDLWLGRYYFK